MNMDREIKALMNVIKSKNVEIKALRDEARTRESVNLILSAYIAIMAEKKGSAVIPKKAISEALGKYLVNATSDADNYVISVIVDEGADAEAKRVAE